MRTLWRISRHANLEGLGGEKASGRWHTQAKGKRIVYLSEHPALALIEVLANLRGDPRLFPDAYQLIRIELANGVSVDSSIPQTLSAGWRENEEETQAAGDEWLASGRSALLAVPSAPSPESLNYLFNPLHASASGVTLGWHRWIAYDKRLFHYP